MPPTTLSRGKTSPPHPSPVSAPPVSISEQLSAATASAATHAADAKAEALKAWYVIISRADSAPQAGDGEALLAIGVTLELKNTQAAFEGDLENVRRYRAAKLAAADLPEARQAVIAARAGIETAETSLAVAVQAKTRADCRAHNASDGANITQQIAQRCPSLVAALAEKT